MLFQSFLVTAPFLEFQFFDFFPAELRITEMSVAGCLGIDRFAQIQFLQDIADFEIKVAANDFQQLFIAFYAGTERIDTQ